MPFDGDRRKINENVLKKFGNKLGKEENNERD